MSHGTLANNDAGGTDTTRSPSTEVADMVEENFRLPSKASRPNGVTENDHGVTRCITTHSPTVPHPTKRFYIKNHI